MLPLIIVNYGDERERERVRDEKGKERRQLKGVLFFVVVVVVVVVDEDDEDDGDDGDFGKKEKKLIIIDRTCFVCLFFLLFY